jgi:transcriptional regulator with XRE-family HTH domain
MGESDTRKEQIAGRLREARRLAGLSQAHVAHMMGWHRPTVSQIEAGERNVAADEIASLAELYEVGVDWLTLCKAADQPDPKLLLAARELRKLKPEDLDALLDVLTAIRRREIEE